MAGAQWDLSLGATDRLHIICVANGNIMVDEKGNQLEIEQVGYGRSSGEIWLKFKNAKTGRNLGIKNFMQTTKFSKDNLNGSSVTVLIKSITNKCPWITVHQRKRQNTQSASENRQSKKQKKDIEISDIEINNNAEFEMRNLPEIKFKEKFIGQHEVNVLTLLDPPPMFRSRKVNQEWVSVIKSKIMEQPKLIQTILPVLIDPDQVKDANEFEAGKLASYRLWTIGGNHIRSALQQIAKDARLNDLRNIHIHLYCGLTSEESLQLGNMHNGSQTSLKPTFQDCIAQGLKIKNSDENTEMNLSKQITQMLRDIEMRDVPKENVGTIVSVLNYGEENINLTQLLFEQFQQKYGKMKSIPQTLFRELQGIEDVKRTSFLEFALQHGLNSSVKEVKNAKKKSKLEACFRKFVGCEDKELCSQLYPEHITEIDKYTDLEMPGNTIPAVFVDFCKEAAENTEEKRIGNFQPVIEINIKVGNINISNLEIVKKVTAGIEKTVINKLLKHEIKILNELGKNSEKTPNPVENNSVNDSGFIHSSMISTSNSEDIVETQKLPNSEENDEMNDSGFNNSSVSPSTSEISLIQDTITDSNMETQPPESQTDIVETQNSQLLSQDLF